MASDYRRSTVKLLKKHDAYRVRDGGKGNHETWARKMDDGEFKFTVPYKIKKKTTANGILRRAGIDERV